MELFENGSADDSENGVFPPERFSYDVAYFILPQYVFRDLSRIVDLCTNSPKAAGPYLYVMACLGREVEPDPDVGLQFRWHAGEIAGRSYLALQYPFPTPLDVTEEDLFNLDKPVILAPYFSIILYGNDSPPNYFILGQAPLDGGTTLRCITEDGTNCNLGPGPEPDFDLFLETVAARESRQ